LIFGLFLMDDNSNNYCQDFEFSVLDDVLRY
jgi:hypothetical protein